MVWGVWGVGYHHNSMAVAADSQPYSFAKRFFCRILNRQNYFTFSFSYFACFNELARQCREPPAAEAEPNVRHPGIGGGRGQRGSSGRCGDGAGYRRWRWRQGRTGPSQTVETTR